MDISEKKKKALKNIAWAICGKIFSLLSILVVGIIVARYLGKEQYGIMNYVISIVAIFQVFADFAVDFLALENHVASGSFINTDNSPADGGFSAAGFAHQAEGFAGINVKADPLYRVEGMTACAEIHLQVPHGPHQLRP